MSNEGDSEKEVGVSIGEVGFNVGETSESKPMVMNDYFLDAFGEGSNTPIITDPKDGLPRPADGWAAPAPPLTKNMVCLEDDDEWVEAFSHEVPNHVGIRFVATPVMSRYDDNGRERERRSWPKSQVIHIFGCNFVPLEGYVEGDSSTFKHLVHVRPKRPRCQHLKRIMMVATDVESTTGPVEPLHSFCTQMVSTSGSFLSLMDEDVRACEFRSPKDIVTEQRIVDRVRRKIEQGKNRKMEVMIPAAKKEPQVYCGQRWEGESYLVGCNPSRLPGESAQVTILDGSHLPELVKQLSTDPDSPRILLVGIDKSSVEHDPAVGGSIHALMVYESDYASLDLKDEDIVSFLEAWPSKSRFIYLADNLSSTPSFLASEAYDNGCDIYVVSDTYKDARFGRALILRHFGVNDTKNMRREHVAYLNRTASTIKVKNHA